MASRADDKEIMCVLEKLNMRFVCWRLKNTSFFAGEDVHGSVKQKQSYPDMWVALFFQ